MTDNFMLGLDFDEDGIWLIEDDISIGPKQLGHISWAVIARHIHPHLEYYDVKRNYLESINQE